MMLTIEDIDFLIHILTAVDPQYPVQKGVAVAERVKALRRLWEAEGLHINEVDVFLLGEEPGRHQLTRIHTYTVDDEAKVDDEEGDEYLDWKISDIRAHLGKLGP